LDTARIKQLIDETVHPIVPLIRVLQAACKDSAGEYIHWGATTQDNMDTALVLQIKDAIALLETRLAELVDVLTELANKYRDTPMAARTHGQQARKYGPAEWATPVRSGNVCAR
jgi:3-carboxy-cis,cis-muconate cycloisomerase